ncbi:MAG TPA: iron-containing redox enzyme family protein [Polyangia bacterium]|nr:iron-containing redox enzyme family protein [Polyangia bacterium]
MTETWYERGAARLKVICQEHGLRGRAAEIQSLFQQLGASWADRPASGGAPFELSLIHEEAGPALSIVAETDAQGRQRLAGDFRVGLESVRAVEELFAPGVVRQALVFRSGRTPSFGVSFDAGARGRWLAPAVVEEALGRLGLARAWPALMSARRGVELDELERLVIDLAPAPDVRVRWRHHASPHARSYSVLGGARADRPPARFVDAPIAIDWIEAAESIAQPEAVLDAVEIVRRYEEDIVLANHPFLARLRREPVNLGHLWTILANFWEAIVHDFPARLAKVIARLDDDALRSVFVKQLNDELGEGDYSRAHKAMFRTLVDAVEPHRPRGEADVLLEPGRQFGAALEARLFGGSWHEAIGALMMIEIYGKQTDLRLGEEFRRQNQLEGSPLTWLRLHESLEVDHADDSLRLARMLPRVADGAEARAQIADVWRGARGVVDAGHAYFDALYRVCFA